MDAYVLSGPTFVLQRLELRFKAAGRQDDEGGKMPERFHGRRCNTGNDASKAWIDLDDLAAYIDCHHKQGSGHHKHDSDCHRHVLAQASAVDMAPLEKLAAFDRGQARDASSCIDADLTGGFPALESVETEAASATKAPIIEPDLMAMLDALDQPFATTLLALIDARGMNDVDVYKRANMSRQSFSQLRSDPQYRPAKRTAIALALALHLSLDEANDLLRRAGYALSRSNKADVIVEYCILNNIYDLMMVNEALYAFDQPTL